MTNIPDPADLLIKLIEKANTNRKEIQEMTHYADPEYPTPDYTHVHDTVALTNIRSANPTQAQLDMLTELTHNQENTNMTLVHDPICTAINTSSIIRSAKAKLADSRIDPTSNKPRCKNKSNNTVLSWDEMIQDVCGNHKTARTFATNTGRPQHNKETNVNDLPMPTVSLFDTGEDEINGGVDIERDWTTYKVREIVENNGSTTYHVFGRKEWTGTWDNLCDAAESALRCADPDVLSLLTRCGSAMFELGLDVDGEFFTQRVHGVLKNTDNQKENTNVTQTHDTNKANKFAATCVECKASVPAWKGILRVLKACVENNGEITTFDTHAQAIEHARNNGGAVRKGKVVVVHKDCSDVPVDKLTASDVAQPKATTVKCGKCSTFDNAVYHASVADVRNCYSQK